MIVNAKPVANQVASVPDTGGTTPDNPDLEPVSDSTGSGRIIGIRGGVVDVLFSEAPPRIHDLLYSSKVPLEVAALLDNGAALS